MAETCIRHPDVAALYYCDGCAERLCADCIEESHALLLCRHCGERALPLHADQPAVVKDLARAKAISRPYSLSEALVYPFRGTGLSLFLAVLGCMLVIRILQMLIVTGLLAAIFNLVLWVMIVGLQFKIVRSTSEGDNELPDWPDFTDVGSLLQDVATWFGIYGIVIVALVYYSGAGLIGGLEPRYGFWLGFVVVLWLGAAFAVMAYGAAGTYIRSRVLYVHRHVQGFLAAGADAVHITNLVFGLGVGLLVLQGFLEESVPLLGGALSSIVGTYWVFLLPHLAGLLFRRHNKKMDQLYWSEYGG